MRAYLNTLEKQNIINYFGYMPEFNVIFLNRDELSSLDDNIKSEIMQHCDGQYISLRKLVVLFKDNSLYHEIGHVVYRNIMRDKYIITVDKIKNENNYADLIKFLDEAFAEYSSFNILGSSDAEWQGFMCGCMHCKNNDKPAKQFLVVKYFFGLYMSSSWNCPDKELIFYFEKLKRLVSFSNNDIAILDFNRANEIVKKIKSYFWAKLCH